jgi:hypothetical protein
MFAAGNKQLVISNNRAGIALILTFSQREKEPPVRIGDVCLVSLSLRERAGVRVDRIVRGRSD